MTRSKKKKLLISFSGGRTSAYMTHRILAAHKDDFDIQVVFANTGQEHENTLRFVHQCDVDLNFQTVWVEAVVNNGRKGCTHKIVTYETAARAGEPYEAMIDKYGIPNTAYPHCTRELKLNPIHSYVKSLGWRKNGYITAIGIRADEKRRVRKDAVKAKIFYPLIDWLPTTKAEIIAWWSQQPFDLDLAEYQGNCVWCWKKSASKLLRLATESPDIFDFPARMERDKGLCGHNVDGTKRVFFRENMSVARLFELAEKMIPEGYVFTDKAETEDSGCGESCELYPTENAED